MNETYPKMSQTVITVDMFDIFVKYRSPRGPRGGPPNPPVASDGKCQPYIYVYIYVFIYIYNGLWLSKLPQATKSAQR